MCPTEAKKGRDDRLGSLLPDAQALDQVQISLVIVLLEIVEQPPSLPYELEEAPAGVMIFDMNLEVPGQVLNPLAEQSDLNFRRPGVRIVHLELLDELPFLLLSNDHRLSVSFPFFS
jgi:hypothetical protein